MGTLTLPLTINKIIIIIIDYLWRPISQEPRALMTDKDIADTLISVITQTHTRTHARTAEHGTLQIHALLVMGSYNDNKTSDQYAVEMDFQF